MGLDDCAFSGEHRHVELDITNIGTIRLSTVIHGRDGVYHTSDRSFGHRYVEAWAAAQARVGHLRARGERVDPLILLDASVAERLRPLGIEVVLACLNTW